MKKLIISSLVFLSLFIPSVYSESVNQNKSIDFDQEALKEFARTYPIEYNKIVELSNLPDSYRNYKINGTYVFFLYKEGPFNVEITVFGDGIIFDYIPKRYGSLNEDMSLSLELNESYLDFLWNVSKMEVGDRFHVVQSRYGEKLKRSKLGKEKLIETLIVLPNEKLIANPKDFALEIAKSDFESDLEDIMRDKLMICGPYDYLSHPEIATLCSDIWFRIVKESHDVNEFENALQELNETIQSKLEKPKEDSILTKIQKFSKRQEERLGSVVWLGGLFIGIAIPILSVFYLIATKGWVGAIGYIKERGKNWLERRVPLLGKGKKQ